MKYDRDSTYNMLFNSITYYTDLGFIENCQNDLEGSYVQFVGNITHIPLQLPMGFCLPKECKSAQYFTPFAEALESKTNHLLDSLKQKVNLEDAYYKITPKK